MDRTDAPLSQNTTPRIVIVDDHPLYSDALETALELVFANCETRKARSLSEAIAEVRSGFEPELVVFDLKLPDVTGISGFLKMRRACPEAKILVISSLASFELVQTLLEQGACGFLPKDTSARELRHVLTQIIKGKTYVPKEYMKAAVDTARLGQSARPTLFDLTPQQQRIMRLICLGKPNKQIAYELSLAEATVKAHITALLRRLGVNNRTEAAVMIEGDLTIGTGADPEARAFLKH